jgi:hypothetical protein
MSKYVRMCVRIGHGILKPNGLLIVDTEPKAKRSHHTCSFTFQKKKFNKILYYSLRSIILEIYSKYRCYHSHIVSSYMLYVVITGCKKLQSKIFK